MRYFQSRYDASDMSKGKYSSRKIPKWNTRNHVLMELIDELKEEEWLGKSVNEY